jgi:hypothetical protein
MLGDRHTDRLLSTLANSRATQHVADAAIDALGLIFDAASTNVSACARAPR